MWRWLDEARWPPATVVAGDPGFIESPHERTLLVHAAANPRDPVLAQIDAGSAVGMLGIDFLTRRRNRVDGVVGALAADSLKASRAARRAHLFIDIHNRADDQHRDEQWNEYVKQHYRCNRYGDCRDDKENQFDTREKSRK